ncbi:MAG: hypothetical protein OXC79_08015, partial [Candidatus Poribacteria bacterium]|nr:hypothetical protein [Candidatus Poribacteria bacterium]
YASITVRRLDSDNYKHQPALFDGDKQPMGIDVGINTLATCSNGDTYFTLPCQTGSIRSRVSVRGGL